MRRAIARTPRASKAVRFLLRLPPGVHRTIVRAAGARGLSLNEYCVRRLSALESALSVHEAAPLLLARAEAVAGPRLIGLVVHGSWARGEARASSDIDILVVVEPALSLTRSLYRKWDERPVAWEGRPVDAHFVHLPRDPAVARSVWCEAAVEGLVLFERDAQISSRLRDIRRAIAEGRLLRKHAHGQPYWTVAA